MTARRTAVVAAVAVAVAGGAGRPRRPPGRIRQVPVTVAARRTHALTTGRGRPEYASTDQRRLFSLTPPPPWRRGARPAGAGGLFPPPLPPPPAPPRLAPPLRPG